jgi:FtsP/CotA-like multicopper oxidase with cupredoxin domain
VIRDIYLKIEAIPGYSPVMPADHAIPPIQYGRDCMRTPGHEDGSIPLDEIAARTFNALIYREYLDAQYLIPKPDKLVAADINEPAYPHRVPGTVIYASPGERLHIHVKNADFVPHSFHAHGLRYGIDSDGAWPLGIQSADGRRSDEICSGSTWSYTYDVTEEMIGAWPFHDHCRDIGPNTNLGLFGGIVVLPRHEKDRIPRMALPEGFLDRAVEIAAKARPKAGLPALPPQPMPTHGMAGLPAPVASPVAPQVTGGMAGMAGMGGMVLAGPGGPQGAGAHHLDIATTPAELIPYLLTIDELAHAPQACPPADELLHVPLFFHQMNGDRQSPVFQSAPMNPGQTFTSAPFTVVATYQYICGIHGAIMSGTVTVTSGGPSTVGVSIAGMAFHPPNVTIGTGGTVTWTNNDTMQHSVLETGGDSLPSYCFNGRSFVGNTPTITAEVGQKIRWYVFNLDLGMNWHNFHPHSARWKFADQTVDVRSIGPAESFVVETVAPPVLLLPDDIQRCQPPHRHPKDAKLYRLRGDFLFHCHVEMHMMGGLAGLVRSQQSVWLTPAQRHQLETTVGLPLDPGTNTCPPVVADRCANSGSGRWEELPGQPGVTVMHAVLLANSDRILFWGYGQRPDQARLWDQTTGLYTLPANQPLDIQADENIWSCGHARLSDTVGTVLINGGFNTGGGVDDDTERRGFLFDPTTNMFRVTGDMHGQRFYPTTITLANGHVMTLYGSVNSGTTPVTSSFEIFDPSGAGGAGAWSAPTPLPFNYLWYPWTFVLPLGDLFIAGPQVPSRRFDYTATPIVDNPSRQYTQAYPQRGVNMDGTAVMLPLKPPLYQPRILLAGGSSTYWSSTEAGALKTAEWIDLSASAPAWQALPDMNVARDHTNSVLLPDGRVLVMGGTDLSPGGGPVEIFDPEDPASGFQLGPSMEYPRGYHSAAILLRDGSVFMGGDPTPFQGGDVTPSERYSPSYFFKSRPVIISAPTSLGYGAAFSVATSSPASIAEVVLMSAGLVTHAFNQNQRYVGCAITGSSGGDVHATAPPDGNVAPPGHYLLYLVDHDRVPSEGAWLRLT